VAQIAQVAQVDKAAGFMLESLPMSRFFFGFFFYFPCLLADGTG
jgi:hypothetical protein